ncbi:uncharacterized protein A1O9_11240 [Exophiala aquamarina CBS 119918]|uniref:Major facilitator superfamily (MFS) profile domain-containing protein n=1 Tax=Exophiala aquamarina CBS 119918 TaxID=1182545 RepID=A0A072P0Q0_9EURO|nr:uncharacterized protein A1O9_11240 [Exophiala aquamarina CBS 119918]KEF52823.1 hypothetical protein A1O9_11240 [Exophiala aquamarina CBS 119918]
MTTAEMDSSAMKEQTNTHEEHVYKNKPQSLDAVSHNIHYPKAWMNWRFVMYLTIVGLSLGLFGYDNTFTGPLLALPIFIVKYQGNGPAFTATNLNLLVPVPLVGAALGTFCATPFTKRFGRKKTFLAAYSLLCTPGSFLQLFAPNLTALIIGRFWNTVGVSVLTTVAPLYLSELAPAHVRGRAIGFCIAGSSAAAIVATTVVWASSKDQSEWQYKTPLAIQAALPVVLGLLTLLVPESPIWAMQRDQSEFAREVFMTLRNNKVDIVAAEMSQYQVSLMAEAQRREKSRFWDILNRTNLKRTLSAGACLSASQVGGQILVLTYSTVILVQSGVGNPFEVTMVISCLIFLGTLVGPVLVDWVGRRPVALFGFSILFILNLAAGSLAAAGLATESQRLGLATVFILFGFFNSVSFQSVSVLLAAEIPTTALREATMSWTIFWSYVTAIVTTFAVPQITSPDAGNLGAKTAFIFAGCVLVTTIWAYFYIPEAKGRTPAEIDEMYAIELPMRKWRGHQCVAVNRTAEMVNRDVRVSDAGNKHSA